MSVDTRQKRASVWEVPGLQMNPYPQGFVSAADREQGSDLYAGIPARTPAGPPSQTCWAPASHASSLWKNPAVGATTWKDPAILSSSFVKGSDGSSSWSSEKHGSPSWGKEQEVTPCADS